MSNFLSTDNGTTVLNSLNALTNGFQGQGTNYKIVISVASNNLTVALKTLAGTDPSTTDPVYIRIGDTVRMITAALSVTKNAATNWCNSGAAELATQEIDYFVHLGYNSTDGVVMGFSRITGRIYSDFSATTTNEKYCAISTITNAAATDIYECIGRFNATLSAGAGYTWSIPATSVVWSKPIYETRLLDIVPTASYTAGTAITGTGIGVLHKYKLVGNDVHIYYHRIAATAGATVTKVQLTLPFSALSTFAQNFICPAYVGVYNTYNDTRGFVGIDAETTISLFCASSSADTYVVDAVYPI